MDKAHRSNNLITITKKIIHVFTAISIWILTCGFQLAPKKIFVSVGINNFVDPAFNSLKYAFKDSVDMNNLFSEHGFEVYTIDNGGTANRQDVVNLLKSAAAENKLKEDTIIFYFSTHGSYDHVAGVNKRYIITTDSRSQDLERSSIDVSDIVDIFDQMESNRKGIILATCHSGEGKSAYLKRLPKMINNTKGVLDEALEASSEGALIFSASRYDQLALEDDTFKNDLYSYFVMKCSRRSHQNRGWSSLTECHEEATRLVFKFTKGAQTPSMSGQLTGTAPLIISGKPKFFYSNLFQGGYLEEKYRIQVDGEEVGFEKGVAKIMPGFHDIQIKDKKTNEKVTRQQNFKSGRDYSIRQFMVPFYKHNLTFALSHSTCQERRLKNRIYGYELKFRRHEVYRGLSLDLGLKRNKNENENSNVFGINSSQSRIESQIFLLGSYPKEISFMSKKDGSLTTTLRLGFGPSVYSRKIERTNESFEKRKLGSLNLGLQSSAEIDIQTHHGVNLGASFSALIEKGLFKPGTVTITSSSSVFVGVYW